MLFSAPRRGAGRPAGNKAAGAARSRHTVFHDSPQGASPMRRFSLIGLVRAGARRLPAAEGTGKKSGPVVAKGNGITITADEFKARARRAVALHPRPLHDARAQEGVPRQPGPLRGAGARGREAGAREGPGRPAHPEEDHGPEARAEELPGHRRDRRAGGARGRARRSTSTSTRPTTSAPRKVRVAAVVVERAVRQPRPRRRSSPPRRRRSRSSRPRRRRTPLAFAQIVTEFSEDAATKPLAGDLQFKCKEELEKALLEGARRRRLLAPAGPGLGRGRGAHRALPR